MTPKKEPDPRHAPLVAEMVRAYEAIYGKYHFQGGKDAMALSLLLKSHTPEEILAMWAKGITAQKEFDRVANIAQLSGKWNQLAQMKTQNANVYREPAPVDVEDVSASPFGPCFVCGRGSWVMLHVPSNQPHAAFLPFCASEDPNHLEAQKRGEFWP